MPPEPGLAREIERIRRLEAAEVIGWWEAADLISQLEDGKRSLIHTLGRLPLADLQARFLQLLSPGERSMHPLSSFSLPADRDRLVAAILDRVSLCRPIMTWPSSIAAATSASRRSGPYRFGSARPPGSASAGT